MEERDKRALQKMYKDLVQVRYDCVSTHLISTFVIDIDMHDEIDSKPTERKKMEKLIQLLPGRGCDAMSKFIEALEPSYSWLAKRLQEETDPGETVSRDSQTDDSSLSALPDLHISQYIRRVRNILVRSTKVCDSWIILARNLSVKNSVISDIRREMSANGGVEYAIMTMLDNWIDEAGRKATFSNLVINLQNERINGTAEDLIDLWKEIIEAKIIRRPGTSLGVRENSAAEIIAN